MAGRPERTLIDAEIRRFRYARADTPALQHVTTQIEAGDFVVLAGRPGSGKTTLSQCLAGVIPHFVHGDYDGRVLVAGHSLNELPLPRIAGLIGYVQQAPANQLFSLSVQEDVAFGPENLGLEPVEIRRRVQRSLDAVGIADLGARLPHELSGGQQQRAVLASVLALEPDCWIFDQPVAELDPAGRDEVYAVIQSLNAAGQTVVVIEDRLSDVANLASRVVVLADGHIVDDRPPAEFFADPARIEPGAGLRLPLAVELFHRLRTYGVDLPSVPLTIRALVDQLHPVLARPVPLPELGPSRSEVVAGPVVGSIQGVEFRYPNGHQALRNVSFDIHAGECVAVVGANGAGKSTLAKHLIGLLKPSAGDVRIRNRSTRGQTPAELSRDVGFLFQDPDYQTFSLSALEEVAFGLRRRKVPAAEAHRRALAGLESVGLAELAELHPYRLSRGQRQLLAVAAVLVLDPMLVVVDEPSTGLDHAQTRAVMDQIDRFRANGHAVLLISHDIEMVTRYAQRCIVMSDGRVSVDVPTRLLGQYADQLRQAAVRLPEIYALQAALGLPPVSTDTQALARSIARACDVG